MAKTRRVLDDNPEKPSVTSRQVKKFLRDNPKFLLENPKLVLDLSLPKRSLGHNVVDLQEAMIRYLRYEIKQVEELQSNLIETTRQNIVNQQKVYDCVHSLLHSRSLENVVDTISTDFAVYLGLTSVVLCMESDEDNLHMLRHVGILSRGMVESILGEKDVIFRDNIFGESEIFGRVAALIRSDAMIRIRVKGREAPVMLAFGSDVEDCFDSEQSPVLVKFLGGCIEQMLQIWVDKNS